MSGDEQAELELDPDRVAINLLAQRARQLTIIVARLNLRLDQANSGLTDTQHQIDEELLDVLADLTCVADHFLAPKLERRTRGA